MKYLVGSDGKQWAVWEACIFCAHTAAVEAFASGYTWPKGAGGPCPANGNGDHIRPGDYPEDILALVKKSRGMA